MIAQTISYILSFIVNFFLSNYFTFKTKPSLKKGIGFAMSHVINWLLRSGLLYVFINYFGIADKYALIPVSCIVFPINFVLVRTVLKSKKLA